MSLGLGESSSGMEEESWLNQDSSPGIVEVDMKEESVEESTIERFNPSNCGMQAAEGFGGPEDEQKDWLSGKEDSTNGEEDLGVEQPCQRCGEEGLACSREHLSEANSFPRQRKSWKQEHCM